MQEQILLSTFSERINKEYVGFGLYKGRKVKPVHIANGALRVLCGKVLDNKGVKKLSLVESKTGTPGYKTEEIYSEFKEKELIEDDINEEAFDATRRVIQKLLDADSGVYIDRYKSDHMLSFSLSSKYFITTQALYEDAGEFVGYILQIACPELTNYIVDLVNNANDPISQLFIPIVSEEVVSEVNGDNVFSDLFPINKRNNQLKSYLSSLSNSGKCLLHNLQRQPNIFTQLRMFNLFCIFSLFRYISYLEAFARDISYPPILLDFSGIKGSVADASSNSYANIRRALSRFCSWAYSCMLKETYSKSDLMHSDDPIRKTGTVSQETINSISSMWEIAKQEAAPLDEANTFSVFGRTINNILAREQDFHPGNYLRALGLLSGLLYPPNSSNNRFVISQDLLEMFLMCTVEPDETIIGRTIRKRLWENCGVLIGGSPFEDTVVREAGLNIQADVDALEDNFVKFAFMMESLGFADKMADGILQIHLGGI